MKKLASALLIGAAIGAAVLSFFRKNDTAGFVFVSAVVCYVLLLGGQLLELAIGPIKVRFQEKIEELERIIERLRKSSLSLAGAISEVVINTGGEVYVGGFGEAAQFIIYRNLRDLLVANDVDYRRELSPLRNILLRDLVYTIVGADQVSKGGGAIMTKLREKNFSEFPSATELGDLAKADGVEEPWLARALSAYRALHEDWDVVDLELPNELHKMRRRK